MKCDFVSRSVDRYSDGLLTGLLHEELYLLGYKAVQSVEG
jgi:hypothetical protein